MSATLTPRPATPSATPPAPRRLSSVRLNLLLAALSVLFALYLGELVVMLMPGDQSTTERGRLEMKRRTLAARGIAVDERLMTTVIDSMRKAGTLAFPATVTKDARAKRGRDTTAIAPLGGLANTMMVMCNEGGPYQMYVADEHGFPSPAGSWSQPVRAALLGDSFANGFCVAPDKSFASLIRARVGNAVNLGISGNGPLAELAGLREYLPSARPPVVLWFYYEGNDLMDLDKEKTDPRMRRYLDAGYSQRLAERQADVDSALARHYARALATHTRGAGDDAPAAAPRRSAARKLVGFLTLYDLRRAVRQPVRALLRLPNDSDPAVTECCDLQLFGQVMRAAKATTDTWGGKIYFVYLPAYERYASRDVFPYLNARDSVLTIAKNLGLTVVDVEPRFRAQKDPNSLWFNPFSHYDETGNRIVAEEVLKALDAGK